eukprot:6189969-Pleurochrysis_carterae.AAC.4
MPSLLSTRRPALPSSHLAPPYHASGIARLITASEALAQRLHRREKQNLRGKKIETGESENRTAEARCRMNRTREKRRGRGSHTDLSPGQ